MIDSLELQKLRGLPIEEVAERLGLNVVRHKCLCPYHDDHHASLTFNLRKNTYHCFACGASGGVIDLVMKLQSPHQTSPGGGFLEACKWLSNGGLSLTLPNREGTGSYQKSVASSFDVSRYERFFLRPWLSAEARRFLFDERKLDPRIISWCKVNSWCDRDGVNWLQIPYYDMEGKLIGMQNRNLGPSRPPLKGGEEQTAEAYMSPFKGDLEGLPRFKFAYGSQHSIYNLPVLKMLKPGEELWITEGCSDCWAMLSSGHKAIAIPSATLLSPKDKELLVSQLTPPHGEVGRGLHMYPDNDVPGERLFLQLKEILPNLEHHHLPPGCKDFADYYVQQQSQ